MECASITSSGIESLRSLTIDPVTFVRMEKYNTRFNVLWRFVAGLLSAAGDKHVLGFFEVLEAEPLDLLGLVHQRLLADCMNETDATQGSFGDKARAIGQSYSEWARLKLQLRNGSGLLDKNECHWLRGTEAEKIALIRVLTRKPNVPSETMNEIMEQVGDYREGEPRDCALVAIAVHCDQYPTDKFSGSFVDKNVQLWLEAVDRKHEYFLRKSQTFVSRTPSPSLGGTAFVYC